MEQSSVEPRDSLDGGAVRKTLRFGESAMVERYLHKLRRRSGWAPVAGARQGAGRQGVLPPGPTGD